MNQIEPLLYTLYKLCTGIFKSNMDTHSVCIMEKCLNDWIEESVVFVCRKRRLKGGLECNYCFGV